MIWKSVHEILTYKGGFSNNVQSIIDLSIEKQTKISHENIQRGNY
jgi:hypothetical protein